MASLAPSVESTCPPQRFEALVHAREHDPFALLGAHPWGTGCVVRCHQPRAEAVELLLDEAAHPMRRVHEGGVFEVVLDASPPAPWTLRLRAGGQAWTVGDAYAFPPQPAADDAYLFNVGRLHQTWRWLGAHVGRRADTAGTVFRVWAPNAGRVSVVGDFNDWDGRLHPMASLGGSGVWELFIPGVEAGALYKFEIRNRDSGAVMTKADPYARAFETRPATAARVMGAPAHRWRDHTWMEQRAGRDWLHAPMNTYELHAGSWMRHPDRRFYTYAELAERLVPYVQGMGFTHIELMPVTEHPLDESWGYQTTGYFAASSRFGTPDDLRAFIDACHQADIGVILDWVPGHFPRDEFALAHFDGSALYEHEDPRMKMHPDWGTHVFNYGRNEVKSFLLSSAHYWLDEFHIDGLRVDAVASMLYLDYSRKAGEWLPNRYGGRENLDAIDFLRELNVMVHDSFPGALTIAEESTSWPMVSRPTWLGGLGFSMKWNMGWMNDTLSYFHLDPVFRRYHHDKLTFGQLYAYHENFVLPLSHDEVVHGKGALIDKMPGDAWQRFANLRLLLAYQMTTPGKKLNFMGNEIGQWREWDSRRELHWDLLQYPPHLGIQRLLADLNHLYAGLPALHDLDFEPGGFRWIDCHDADHSVLSFVRQARDGSHVVVVLNFTPVPRPGYRIGVPQAGMYEERFNSDSEHYGGGNVGNCGRLEAIAESWGDFPARLDLMVPPFGAVILLPAA